MYIETTDSTNTLLKQMLLSNSISGPTTNDERLITYIYAGYQTAGRGQTGNGWESAPKQNLLCSILMPPRQNLFELNVLVSLAVYRVVTQSISEAVAIKWPNDIYWQDKKLAGILIENAIIGSVLKYSIAGIGLNVNQTEWHSDAPNPVSLMQITGREHNIDDLMQQLLNEINQLLKTSQEAVWHEYCSHLYRREGLWPFVEREVSTAPTTNAKADANAFLARIENILPTGEIVLRDQQGHQRTYHFKQIRYVI